MPVAQIRGIQMNYDVLGDAGPWVALAPGGRVGMAGIQEMAESLAGKVYRVLIFDRRNCGASDVGISSGASEFDEWADDLFELTKQLGAQPCIAGWWLVRLPDLAHLRHTSSRSRLRVAALENVRRRVCHPESRRPVLHRIYQGRPGLRRHGGGLRDRVLLRANQGKSHETAKF